MSVVTLDFTDGVSGNIDYTLAGGYVATTGALNAAVVRHTGALYTMRAFFQFDTGSYFSLYDVTSIDFVELYIALRTSQPSIPSYVDAYIGNWIGPSLDGSSADFNGGNFMIDSPPGGFVDKTYYNLGDGGHDPTGYVSLTGTTDIALRGVYTAAGQGQNYNWAKDNCRLRVTFTGTLKPASISTRGLLGVGT